MRAVAQIFLSFFFIPSLLLTNKKHSKIKRAFLYYYFNTETKLEKLVENGLYFMKQNGMDVVNCIKQYNNEQFINKLKFMEGSGGLNFYFLIGYVLLLYLLIWLLLWFNY